MVMPMVASSAAVCSGVHPGGMVTRAMCDRMFVLCLTYVCPTFNLFGDLSFSNPMQRYCFFLTYARLVPRVVQVCPLTCDIVSKE